MFYMENSIIYIYIYIYDWLSKNVPFHDLGVSEILAINRGPNG
jgi:hypothetical protein